MLVLSFRSGEFAFVFHRGIPIGAIVVPKRTRGGEPIRFPIVFAGGADDFEVLRPIAVERRYGKQQLQRLTEQFLLPAVDCARE